MPNPQNLKAFTGANDPRRSNGRPKGTLNLSTHIQNVLNDEEFDTYIEHPTKGRIEFKGAPILAIITVAVRKAVGGDDKAREWLAKYGYGASIEVNSEEINVKYEIVNRVPSPKD
jgi:hypothetical protein